MPATVGPSSRSKAYKVLNLRTGKVEESIHVKFNESTNHLSQDAQTEEEFEIPMQPQQSMTSDDESSESSDEEAGASSLNINATPFVPQSSEELVTGEEEDLRTPTQEVRETTTGLRSTNSMIRAHPPTQMLSSVTDGVRTRSSYETLLANHANRPRRRAREK